jgi:predicted HicB family RNase H-like nuclease
MKKVNIGISKETHAKAKIISVLQGITLNDYLAEAIEKAVEKDKGVLAKIKL